MNFTPFDSGKMLFFANITTSNNGLNISGSNGRWEGIAYAPHSTMQYSGSSNLTGAGSIVVRMLDGNNATIAVPVGVTSLELQYDQVRVTGQTATATYTGLYNLS